MSAGADLRKERIDRLLRELEHEITRGVLEREIEPDLAFSKLMPLVGHASGMSMAALEVRLYPTEWGGPSAERRGPRLRLIPGDKA